MVKFISFHSFKGGTGKTTLATNFAALSAQNGMSVCLLDFDFRAPSLHAFFGDNASLWLNDYLNDKCRIIETLHEIDIADAGKLAVGFANPSAEAVRDMMTKDREWEAKALHHILSAKVAMLKERFDLVVFDTSPGIQYSSVNALAASNIIVFIMNMDEIDREDIGDVIDKLYRPFGHKMGVVLNKVLLCLPGENSRHVEKARRESSKLTEIVEHKLGLPVWGVIPCFCEVLLEGNMIHAFQKPNHPFVTDLSAVADNIQRN